MRTRTADFYRVKAASSIDDNLDNLEARLSNCKYDEDGTVTGEITGEEIFVRMTGTLRSRAEICHKSPKGGILI